MSRGQRESSEDETRRLFETPRDPATISIKTGRIAGATINEGPASTTVSSRTIARNFVEIIVIWNIGDLRMLLEIVHEERKNVGFRKGGTSAVGAMTFGGTKVVNNGF